MNTELTVKNMDEPTALQLAAPRVLTVSEHQEVLGKSFKESIEDWESAHHDKALGLSFLLDGQPVGLALFMKQQDHTASIHG